MRSHLLRLSYNVKRYNHAPTPFYPKSYVSQIDSIQTELLNVLPNSYTQPQPKIDDHVVIAMSSGVDSSVCAAMFKDHPKALGLYMANWSQNSVCIERDWIEVQKICSYLNIPCERVNFEFDYWTNVFEPMIEKYRLGLTPNPDINCNKFVKFGKLCEYLNSKFEQDNWKLVTGHYARIMQDSNNEYQLLRSLSTKKDQSYYLSSISSTHLDKILLPIGHFTKPQIRKLAKEQYNLPNFSKPDSQGLCFVNPNEKNFRQFLDQYLEPNPGNIITEDGKIWGKHQGLWHATIGQRSSISMPQGDPVYNGVWYVSEKNPTTNEIIIVKGHDNSKLFKQFIKVNELNLFYSQDEVLQMENLSFQYSSLTKPIEIHKLKKLNDNELMIELMQPARAIAPGQGGVIYRDNQVIGCGVIM